MKYFYLEPEVAGGLGENTVMDSSQHPPLVHKLHYVFDVWLGDGLLESFPCFIATDSAMQKLQNAGVTGIEPKPVEVTASEEFHDLYPDKKLPFFVWMQVEGIPGLDDFGIAKDLRLVISERALDIIKQCGLDHATLAPFEEQQLSNRMR